MKSMKAVYYHAHGGPEALEYGDLAVPDCGDDQVLVKVAAAAVNPIDRRLRAGELQEYISRSFPVVPGWDFSGVIAAVGKNVSGWKQGDPVVGLAFTWAIQHGTYAEYAPVNASAIATKPLRLSFDEAAALPLVSLTAWQTLAEFGDLQPGHTVLIQAGAGGLGSVAIQIAKHLGAVVYTTASAANAGYVRDLGADQVIDYRADDYVSVIREQQPDGLDMVLESLLSDATTKAAIRLVKNGGTVAYMNNEPPDTDEIEKRSIKTEFIHHRADGESLGRLMAMYETGVLRLPELRRMRLEAAQQAHIISETGHTRGKLVLHIQDL